MGALSAAAGALRLHKCGRHTAGRFTRGRATGFWRVCDCPGNAVRFLLVLVVGLSNDELWPHSSVLVLFVARWEQTLDQRTLGLPVGSRSTAPLNSMPQLVGQELAARGASGL